MSAPCSRTVPRWPRWQQPPRWRICWPRDDHRGLTGRGRPRLADADRQRSGPMPGGRRPRRDNGPAHAAAAGRRRSALAPGRRRCAGRRVRRRGAAPLRARSRARPGRAADRTRSGGPDRRMARQPPGRARRVPLDRGNARDAPAPPTALVSSCSARIGAAPPPGCCSAPPPASCCGSRPCRWRSSGRVTRPCHPGGKRRVVRGRTGVTRPAALHQRGAPMGALPHASGPALTRARAARPAGHRGARCTGGRRPRRRSAASGRPGPGRSRRAARWPPGRCAARP